LRIRVIENRCFRFQFGLSSRSMGPVLYRNVFGLVTRVSNRNS